MEAFDVPIGHVVIIKKGMDGGNMPMTQPEITLGRCVLLVFSSG